MEIQGGQGGILLSEKSHEATIGVLDRDDFDP